MLFENRPERIGSVWMSGSYVHGPRFVLPRNISEGSYFIRGDPQHVRTKMARPKYSDQPIVQSRLRPIYAGELPMLTKVIPGWIIDLGKYFQGRLFLFYTFYFTEKQADSISEDLQARGYRIRIVKGARRGVPIFMIYRYKPGHGESISLPEVINQNKRRPRKNG